MKPTVILDIDDVVADLIKYWIKLIHERYGVYAAYEQITEWELEKCTPEYGQLGPAKLFGFFNEPAFWANVPLVPGALEGVKTLNDETKLHFLTAREGPAIAPTYEWFKKNLPFINTKQLIFSADKSIFIGDVFVEDRDKHLKAYVEAPHLDSALVIGVERPHNNRARNDEHADIWVSPDEEGWKKIVEAVLEEKLLTTLNF